MGDHEKRRNIMCHLKDISCGNPCGKPLPCGLHNCTRPCHRSPCIVPKEDAGPAEKEGRRGRNKKRGAQREKEKEKGKEKEKEKETEEEHVGEKEKEGEESEGEKPKEEAVVVSNVGAWDEGTIASTKLEDRPSCGQVCGARLKTCVHTCPANCHPNRPCPSTVCQQMVS